MFTTTPETLLTPQIQNPGKYTGLHATYHSVRLQESDLAPDRNGVGLLPNGVDLITAPS